MFSGVLIEQAVRPAFFSPGFFVGLVCCVITLALGFFLLGKGDRATEANKDQRWDERNPKEYPMGKVDEKTSITSRAKIRLTYTAGAVLVIIGVFLALAGLGRVLGYMAEPSLEGTRAELAETYDLQFQSGLATWKIIPEADSFTFVPDVVVGDVVYDRVRISRAGDVLTVWVPEAENPDRFVEIQPVG